MLENFDQAISDLSFAIELDPEYADAYYIRSQIYEYTGDTARSEEDYAKAIELDSGLAQ